MNNTNGYGNQKNIDNRENQSRMNNYHRRNTSGQAQFRNSQPRQNSQNHYKNDPEVRSILNIHPFMVLWLKYTQQFKKIENKFRVHPIYLHFDVELSGSRQSVQNAEDHIYNNLLHQYNFHVVDLPYSQQVRNLYRPYLQAMHTNEYKQIQRQDDGFCLLIPYKINKLFQDLYDRYQYQGADKLDNLPLNYVLIFCKKQNAVNLKIQINRLVSNMTNILINDTNRQNAPRFNSGGLQQQKSNGHKFIERIIIKKMYLYLIIKEMLFGWPSLKNYKKSPTLVKYSSNIKIQEMTELKSMLQFQYIQQQIKIQGYNQKNIDQAYDVIVNEYLLKYGFERMEFEFSNETIIQDIVTQELKDQIKQSLIQAKPEISQKEMISYRFIETNQMNQTAFELDQYYKTTIMEDLDERQNNKKYIYILGLKKLFPMISDSTKQFLYNLHRQDLTFTLEKEKSDVYLQNVHDESVILEQENQFLDVEQNNNVQQNSVDLKKKEFTYFFDDLMIDIDQCEKILYEMQIQEYNVSYVIKQAQLKVIGQSQTLDTFNEDFLEAINRFKMEHSRITNSSYSSSIFDKSLKQDTFSFMISFNQLQYLESKLQQIESDYTIKLKLDQVTEVDTIDFESSYVVKIEGFNNQVQQFLDENSERIPNEIQICKDFAKLFADRIDNNDNRMKSFANKLLTQCGLLNKVDYQFTKKPFERFFIDMRQRRFKTCWKQSDPKQNQEHIFIMNQQSISLNSNDIVSKNFQVNSLELDKTYILGLYWGKINKRVQLDDPMVLNTMQIKRINN